MKTRASVLNLMIAIASLHFCSAGWSAPAPINLTFTGSTAPVYDLTGTYRIDQDFFAGGNPTRLTFSMAIQQDASGRLQGSGPTVVRLGDDYFLGEFTVKGRISGGGKRTRAALVARVQETDLAPGVKPSFSISVRYDLEVKPEGLKGTARGQARFAQAGSGRIKSTIPGVPLPPGMDGSWSVQMDIPPFTKFSGTGAILLSNGRTLQASLSGSSAAFSDLSSVKLAGTSADRGNTVRLSFYPQTRTLQKLSGKVLGQTVAGVPAAAQYIGMQACIECHGPIYQTLINTPHAQVGVQCESCHGPAAEHAANCYDPLVRPKVDLTGTSCGTCHSGAQHPTYEEWSSSAHATLFGDLNATNRINTCAQCHSGSVRINLLDGIKLPAAGANVPITCPTCHTPHEITANPFQLRNPLASTNDFSLNMNVSLTNQYDPNLNLCAQCHNRREASLTNNASAPHRSPQYNLLLGNVGELPSGPVTSRPAAHAGFPESAVYSFSGTFYLTNQCASCHMQDDSAPDHPASHTFTVDTFGVCYNCHNFDPELLVKLVAEPAVSNRVQSLKYGLDLWASTKAPPALQTNGVLAWEYTTPGGLIWQTNGNSVGWVLVNQVNFRGPDAAGQELIPENIRKARYNLYLVLGDRSFGVHNPFLATDLLEASLSWVSDELNK